MKLQILTANFRSLLLAAQGNILSETAQKQLNDDEKLKIIYASLGARMFNFDTDKVADTAACLLEEINLHSEAQYVRGETITA